MSEKIELEPLNIEVMDLSVLSPALYNPRKDLKAGDKEFESLKKSISEFGYLEPIVWNRTSGKIVGGHQRAKALADLGISSAEVIIVELDEDKEKLANIALNKISGSWDFTKLADLLQELDTGANDMSLSGFDTAEIESIMNYVRVDDYSDLDKESDALAGNEDETITITVPKKHYESVVAWIADGESKTGAGLGRGIMKKCGLL